jgi:hypothetical protein
MEIYAPMGSSYSTNDTSSRNGARESGVSGIYGTERSSEQCKPPSPPNKNTRRGKWVRFSGTDEELARIALDHAKYIAAKRRPRLQQISHSMSRRNGFNTLEEYDTVSEHWCWAPNNSYNCQLQLQAINCSVCGNYQSVSNVNIILPNNICCNCYYYNDDLFTDGLEEFKDYEYDDRDYEPLIPIPYNNDQTI